MSRGEVLARVRQALAGDAGTAPEPIPRDYRSSGEYPAGHPRLIELLIERLEDYRAHVHRAAEAEIPGVVGAILAPGPAASQAQGLGPRVVVPPGLPGRWVPATIEAVADDDLSPEQLEALDGVLTAAAVAIAETGTVVLDASADQGRRIITLLPDVHVCVIRPEQVVASVPEALAMLRPGRPQTWISGPSATSDIELDRVEGVHGPRTLHVVIVEHDAAQRG